MKRKTGKKEGGKTKRFFKSVNDVSKKSNEHEKLKREKKKADDLAQLMPKGYKARKTGVAIAYALFAFMFILVVFSFVNSNKKSKVNADDILINESDVQAVEFGKEFLHTYLNVSNDEKKSENRELRMNYFLDASLRDIKINSSQWETVVNKEGITLVRQDVISNDRSNLVYQVDMVMQKEIEGYEDVIVFSEKDSVAAKRNENEITEDELDEDEDENEDEKSNDDESLDVDILSDTEGKVMRVKVPTEEKRTTKFVSVPVQYNSDVKRFVVTDYPSFVGIDRSSRIKTNYSVTDGLIKSDSEIENNVELFLPTFFNAYLNDDSDKLVYLLKDEKNTEGLSKSGMKLSTIDAMDVYNGKTESENIVRVTVELVDKVTGLKFPTTYYLTTLSQSGSIIVIGLNDMKYIQHVAKGISLDEQPTKNNNNDTTENNDTSNEEEVNTDEDEDVDTDSLDEANEELDELSNDDIVEIDDGM